MNTLSSSSMSDSTSVSASTSARFPLGSVLVMRWGYSMVLNSFFQVVGHTLKGIKVRAIGSDKKGGSFQGQEAPLKGVWDDGCIFTKGKVRTILAEKKGAEIAPQIDKKILYVVKEGTSFAYDLMD